jgi:hypothetical protein
MRARGSDGDIKPHLPFRLAIRRKTMATQADLIAALTNSTLTENGAPAFTSTLSGCLDFYFLVVPGIDRSSFLELLDKSWNEDPLVTLKLIFQLRNIRDGKNDKKNFYYAAQWLLSEHPETLIANIKSLPAHGYWKDCLEILKWALRESLTKDECKFRNFFAHVLLTNLIA